MLVTALDDVAWMLNLRGNDIEYNPLFFSYVLLHRAGPKDAETYSADLFIDQGKVQDAAVLEHLSTNNITVHDYTAVVAKLKEYAAAHAGASAAGGGAEDAAKAKKKISVDTKQINQKLFEALEAAEYELVAQDATIEHLKAAKNAVQQEGMRQCNIRDCAAIMKYFAFLEEELAKPDHGLDEFMGAEKVTAYRAMGELFKGPSFEPISSIGANGAIIHYAAAKDTAVKLNNDEIYLLDSGGQYLDGTTDITRCAHFGGKAPTAFQKQAYTAVLLGNLDVERVVWPSTGTYHGGDFDILARRHLFAAGLDYKHGTGHGVGSLLCVHEGPIGISRGYTTKFIEGMCVSDEPGYYHDGEFGIRIENVVMVQKHEKFDDRLVFENLTVAPYERELIDINLVDQGTIDYLNKHHEKCLAKLTPLLQDDPRALAYVTKKCAPLAK